MVLTKKKFLKLLEENTGFKQNISIGITINIDQKLLLKRENNRYYLSVEGKEIEVRKLTNVIESNIEGDFKGWGGESIYSLRNGQIWKQDEYQYEYVYEYAPEVMIYESPSGVYMAVAGTQAKVKRIR